MDCKWHPGRGADLTCMKCGQQYCRECVRENKATHYCPDCQQAEVNRFASQLGGTQAPKQAKAPKQKAPKPEPVAKEKKEGRKQLKKPSEAPSGPPITIPQPAPQPPPPSVSASEKADFWGESEPSSRWSRRRGQGEPPPPPSFEPVPVEQPPTPPVRQVPPAQTAQPVPPAPTAQPAPPQIRAVPPIEPTTRIQGMPPPPPAARPPVAAPPPAVPGGPDMADVMVPLATPRDRRPILKPEEREKAVMVAEGFPTGPQAEEEDFESLTGRRQKRSRSRSKDGVVSMQVPDEYSGELTTDPHYVKATLWGLLAGLIGGGIYSALAWWLHGERGIVGVLIGLAVGITVVFTSGRHFNWKLGLLAAVISLLFLSAGRIFVYMLTIWFPTLPIHLPFSTMHNLSESFTQFLQQFKDWRWDVIFAFTGVLAFITAARPWPIRLQLSQGASPATRRKA